MERVNLTDLERRFDELIDRAAAGETIEIVRDGKPIARMAPPEKPRNLKPIDVEALRRLAATMPYQGESAVDLIRRMRDSGY